MSIAKTNRTIKETHWIQMRRGGKQRVEEEESQAKRWTKSRVDVHLSCIIAANASAAISWL